MEEEPSHIKHYLAYSLSYFVYGLIYNGIGPLIPYLSEKSHQPETSYSFIFTCRAIGMVLGALACKMVQAKKMMTYHQAIAISSFGTFLMCFSFTYAMQFMAQGVSFLFNSFFTGVIQTFINTSIIILSSDSNLEKTFIIILGCFGLGGLFGPIFVYYFQDKTFLIFGIAMLILAPAYLSLQSSQKTNAQNRQKDNKQQVYISDYGANLLCLLAFIYLGTLTSIGGWSSSYAVLRNVNTKETAVIYPSLFWTLITLSRFAFAFLPATIQKKMCRVTEAALVFQILAFLIKQLGYIQFSLYFQSIVIGVAISPLYPLIYSISQQFGYQLRESHISTLVGIGPVGQGLLTMICGQLMDWIHIDMYYYVVIALMTAIYWCRIQLISVLKYSQNMDAEQKLIQLNYV